MFSFEIAELVNNHEVVCILGEFDTKDMKIYDKIEKENETFDFLSKEEIERLGVCLLKPRLKIHYKDGNRLKVKLIEPA